MVSLDLNGVDPRMGWGWSRGAYVRFFQGVIGFILDFDLKCKLNKVLFGGSDF